MSTPRQPEDFMRQAIELSRQNVAKGGGPFAAVIVKDGEVIATGCNQVTQANDPTAHAEVVAIRNACARLNNFQLDGCEIYTSCEPCPMCLGAIYWARPERVYYANSKEDAAAIDFDDQFIYEELDRPLHQRQLPMIRLLAKEAIEAFRDWQQKTDKVEY
jgi:tRNA(Arg) A34 adenosine deaminase TadA